MPRPTLILLVATLAACNKTPPATSPTPAPTTAAAVAPRKDIRWFRNSAEYRGIAMEVYRAAADHLPALSSGLATGTWAVILDADETVLDNSAHERELAARGETYTEAGWSAWVKQRAAAAIPGAVEFTRKVHAMGGRIAIVTNRADSLCSHTRENLKSVGVDADIVLCQQPGVSDKNPRFARVQNGTAAPGIGALTVIEWIGDNIQDFPMLTQAVRTVAGGYADFGVRFFLLPNPMYGSWERNPDQ